MLRESRVSVIITGSARSHISKSDKPFHSGHFIMRESNTRFPLYSIFVSGTRNLYDQIFNALYCDCKKERIIRCEVVKKKK